MQPEASGTRARAVLAIAAGILLAGLVAAVLTLGGGDESRSTVAAPPDCIRQWNGDRAATAYGRHNFNFHEYEGALVTFLDPAGAEVEEGEGRCAVIFPSRVLDPEPVAAGQVLGERGWTPISELPGIELSQVGELQVDAAAAPNTTLDTTGKLSADGSG